MSLNTYTEPISSKPVFKGNGEKSFYVSNKLVRKQDEIALGLQFISKRQLFGQVYSSLLPKYFWNMPKGSGVYIAPFVDSQKIKPDMNHPGDVDLLIIPYESDQLMLGYSMAVELKILRGSYKKQGKSPNQYGFTQASSLINHGFPYVAVIHLVTSDSAPKDHWEDAYETTLLDQEGNVSELEPIKLDLTPWHIANRNHGRLMSNRTDKTIGISTAYLAEKGIHQPFSEKCIFNPTCKIETLEYVGKYYRENYSNFMDTPRF